MAAGAWTQTVPQQFQQVVTWAAGVIGIPPAVVAAQINEESGFHGGCGEVSSAGAVGIAQFLPSTFSGLGCSGSPCNDNDAFKCYAKYMYQLVRQYKGNVRDALSAYNCGSPCPAGDQYADTILANAGSPGGLTAKGGSGQSSSSPGTGASDEACAAKWPHIGPVGGGCMIQKRTLRHAAGIALMAAGGVVALPGVLILVAFGLKSTGAGRAAVQVAGALPTPAGRATRRAAGRAAETPRSLRAQGASDVRTSVRRTSRGTETTRELTPEARRRVRESQRTRVVATGPNATAADRRRAERDKPPF